jgi:hypothetical protein
MPVLPTAAASHIGIVRLLFGSGRSLVFARHIFVGAPYISCNL